MVVDVFAADDVYLGVPVTVECIEGCELLALLLGEVGEVFQYLFHLISF